MIQRHYGPAISIDNIEKQEHSIQRHMCYRTDIGFMMAGKLGKGCAKNERLLTAGACVITTCMTMLKSTCNRPDRLASDGTTNRSHK